MAGNLNHLLTAVRGAPEPMLLALAAFIQKIRLLPLDEQLAALGALPPAPRSPEPQRDPVPEPKPAKYRKKGART